MPPLVQTPRPPRVALVDLVHHTQVPGHQCDGVLPHARDAGAVARGAGRAGGGRAPAAPRGPAARAVRLQLVRGAGPCEGLMVLSVSVLHAACAGLEVRRGGVPRPV